MYNESSSDLNSLSNPNPRTASFGLASFLIGIAVGAGAALLFSPASGQDVRRKVGETARRLGDQAREKIGQVKDQVKDRMQQNQPNAGQEAFQPSHEPGSYR